MKIPVPLKDQRTEKTFDGHPPEDGNMDCVPTSLAAMCQGLLGGSYSGDDLHDRVYGQGYTGMQDPARFASLLGGFGIAMARVNGSPAALVARACAEIAAAHPVLIAIPSDWGDEPPHSPFAHMVAGCDLPDADHLTAMNPWGGFCQTQSRAWWQERIAHCSYQAIWILAKKETHVSNNIPAGWHDDGATLTAPNGHRVVLGFRQYILTNAWNPADQPLEEERHLERVEWHNPGLGAGSRQIFVKTVLRWNNAREGVQREWVGAELQAVEQQLADAQHQLAEAQTQAQAHTQPQAQPPAPLSAGDQAAVQAMRALAAALAVIKA